MIRPAKIRNFILIIIFCFTGSEPGLCEEKCPLEVTDWQPKGYTENARPTISATFRSACGADIEQSSIEMRISGSTRVAHTVTGSGPEVTVTFTLDFLLKEDELHTVSVRAQDVNGVLGKKAWDFYIPLIY